MGRCSFFRPQNPVGLVMIATCIIKPLAGRRCAGMRLSTMSKHLTLDPFRRWTGRRRQPTMTASVASRCSLPPADAALRHLRRNHEATAGPASAMRRWDASLLFFFLYMLGYGPWSSCKLESPPPHLPLARWFGRMFGRFRMERLSAR